jgi:cell wall assembly regulator SMI1
VAVVEWPKLLDADDGYELRPGADADEVTAVEAALEAVFPEQLREVYQTSNGVFDRPGQWFVIWPLREVAIQNSQAWSLTDNPARLGLVGSATTGQVPHSAFRVMAAPAYWPGLR